MYYQINEQQSQSHVIRILTDDDIQKARKTTTLTNRYKKNCICLCQSAPILLQLYCLRGIEIKFKFVADDE